MRRALLLPTLLPLLLLFAAGCSSEPDTTDVVQNIPWADGERLEYVVLDLKGEEQRGTGVLEATRNGEQWDLHLAFEGQGNTDESLVKADATTLKPSSSHREFTGSEEGTVDAVYDAVEKVVTITVKGNENRTVPHRLKDHYYDNDSSLYLWRTINFSEGFQASYHAVVANFASQPLVSIEVLRKESVTVPAGTFDAWKVAIRTEDRNQFAWFTDTPEHVLLEYNNDFNSILRLQDLPSE
jgi:hypothetical protein